MEEYRKKLYLNINMGFQLWYSPETGIRRKGTTFSELQDIFISNITTNHIYEPLACCKLEDNSLEVRELMGRRDFDVLGVVQDSRILGYVRRVDLGAGQIADYFIGLNINLIISDSTPISELLDLFRINDFLFVLYKNEVSGIITKADINKPITRIYLFSIISLFEFHLNYWINNYYNNDSWQELLKEKRITLAKATYLERKGNNMDLTLLECLQISDKKEILRNTDDFLKIFEFSKSSFKDILEKIGMVRNELAHSQNSIISNLAWNDFADSIHSIKSFLGTSESRITN